MGKSPRRERLAKIINTISQWAKLEGSHLEFFLTEDEMLDQLQAKGFFIYKKQILRRYRKIVKLAVAYDRSTEEDVQKLIWEKISEMKISDRSWVAILNSLDLSTDNPPAEAEEDPWHKEMLQVVELHINRSAEYERRVEKANALIELLYKQLEEMRADKQSSEEQLQEADEIAGILCGMLESKQEELIGLHGEFDSAMRRIEELEEILARKS